MARTIFSLKDVHEKLPGGFHDVCIETSGICNAKCKYCPSGLNKKQGGGFMSASMFEDIVTKLIDYGIVGCDSLINLFWWGECVLNPELDDIIAVTQKLGEKAGFQGGEGIPYIISTNAYHYREFQPGSLRNIKRFIISVPGFSQRSYDKIHEFDFELIKSNITKYVKDLKKAGQIDKIWMAYCTYQFSLTEIWDAYRFCEQQGISLNIGFAFPLLVKERVAYANGKLDEERKEQIYREIVTDQLDRMIQSSNRKDCVYQIRNFIVNYDGGVQGCLNIEPDDSNFCGNILEDNIEEIIQNISKLNACSECLSCGVAPMDMSFRLFYDDWFNMMKLVKFYENNSSKNTIEKARLVLLLRELENDTCNAERNKANEIQAIMHRANIRSEELIELIRIYAKRPEVLKERLRSCKLLKG